MLWILSIVIILYISSYLIWRKNKTFLKVRKWIDISTLVVISVLVVAWIEVFHYSFYFIIYFFVSMSVIVSLVIKLRKTEVKQKKAETVIKVLKDEEELLEAKLQENNTNEQQ